MLRHDNYGEVETEYVNDSICPRVYSKDCLETLLALCRIMGLRYKIENSDNTDWLTIKLYYGKHLQTDFYTPRINGGCFTTICVKRNLDDICHQLMCSI